MVERAIAMRGYHSVMNELLIALHNLGEAVLAEPQNQLNEREFKMWTHAAQIAVMRHTEECTFDQFIEESDTLWAREMGIRLN